MTARAIAARAWQIRPTLMELGGVAVLVGLAHLVTDIPLALLIPATLACLVVAAAWTATVELREEQRHAQAPHDPGEPDGEPS